MDPRAEGAAADSRVDAYAGADALARASTETPDGHTRTNANVYARIDKVDSIGPTTGQHVPSYMYRPAAQAKQDQEDGDWISPEESRALRPRRMALELEAHRAHADRMTIIAMLYQSDHISRERAMRMTLEAGATFEQAQEVAGAESFDATEARKHRRQVRFSENADTNHRAHRKQVRFFA